MKPIPVLLMARELNLGGTERQLAETARALDREAFTPHVGCFHEGGFRADELRAAGVPVVRFPVTSLHGPSGLLGARAMGAYLRANGIELVHTFDVPMNMFGVPVARMFGARRVVASQRAHRSLTPGLTRHALRVTDQIADAIVVNCESVRRELIEEDRVRPGMLHLCYNGIDTSVFHPEGRRTAETVTVGIVCALRPEKDLGTLLRAFARVRDSYAGVRLVITGDGAEREPIAALARELSLGESFTLEPATQRVAERLRTLDVCVLPSRSEALSNSLMEAMACGCAVAASRTGGNPELVTQGLTGLLFAPGDVEDLAAQLRVLIGNAEARQYMANAAARRIREEFSLAIAARRMGAIYHGLLTQRA